MPLLGAHQSIAGGFYKAVEQAAKLGCEVVQLFTAAPQQWPVGPAAPSPGKGRSAAFRPAGSPISDEDAAKFREALETKNISHPLAHDSYLINLGAPDDAIWLRSVRALEEELRRADRLGIPYLVAHPGAYTTSSEAEGLARIIDGLDEIHKKNPKLSSRVLLENTAGQGSTLGWKLDQLTAILEGVKDPSRLGVCLDTCHLFAAGYPLATRDDYEAAVREIDRCVGIERVKAWHLNDSVKDCGSRVDRHAHIGQGKIGLEAFRHLVNDERFAHVPMYLETPKETISGEEMDVVNLRTLRGLVGRGTGKNVQTRYHGKDAPATGNKSKRKRPDSGSASRKSSPARKSPARK